jgi:hypothetical protein
MAILTVTGTIQRVRGLADRPIETEADLKAWYDESRAVKSAILEVLWDDMPLKG